MHNSSYKKILTAVLVFIFPVTLHASEIRLESNRADMSLGDEFSVTVVLNSQESINAVEGEILFDSKLLEVQEIRDGNSSINFWIEKPKEIAPGKVSFSGMTPGGLKGITNPLFNIVFVSKGVGQTQLTPHSIIALQNDGKGTSVEMDIEDVAVLIREGDNNTYVEYIHDTTSPEDFNPIIARDPALFDNQYFVTFATQDKDSGIARYEIREFKFKLFSAFSFWKEAESPYVLKNQNLDRFIEIKAVDNNKNVRVAEILPQNKIPLWQYMIYFSLLLCAFASVCYLTLKKLKK